MSSMPFLRNSTSNKFVWKNIITWSHEGNSEDSTMARKHKASINSWSPGENALWNKAGSFTSSINLLILVHNFVILFKLECSFFKPASLSCSLKSFIVCIWKINEEYVYIFSSKKYKNLCLLEKPMNWEDQPLTIRSYIST